MNKLIFETDNATDEELLDAIRIASLTSSNLSELKQNFLREIQLIINQRI